MSAETAADTVQKLLQVLRGLEEICDTDPERFGQGYTLEAVREVIEAWAVRSSSCATERNPLSEDFIPGCDLPTRSRHHRTNSMTSLSEVFLARVKTAHGISADG